MGKAEARALAANYMSRIVDPVINPAICYVHVCVAINQLELGRDLREIHATILRHTKNRRALDVCLPRRCACRNPSPTVAANVYSTI